MSLDGIESVGRASASVDSSALRFDLRFEAGVARLRLAEPLRGVGYRVNAMELDLGRIPQGLDLSSGFDMLRRRRTRLMSVDVEITIADLERSWSRELGVEFSMEPGESAGSLEIAIKAGGRVAATTVHILPSGSSARMLFSNVRSSADGAETPWKQMLDTARLVGLRFDERSGALLWPEPMWQILARALVPFGWRVPDLGQVLLEVPSWEDGALRLKCGRVAQSVEERDEQRALYRLEETRLSAPAIAALAQGQPMVAYQAVSEECVRLKESEEAAGESAERLAALALAIQAELPEREASVLAALPGAAAMPESLKASLEMRMAMRGDDMDTAVAAARRVVELEPSTLLATDAAYQVAKRIVNERPVVADDLLRRAMARAPEAVDLLLLRSKTVAALRDREGLTRLGRLAGRARLGGRSKARVYAALADAFIQLDEVAEARLLVEQAEALAPDAVATLEALATLHERDGNVARAVTRLDRAAEQMRAAGSTAEAARLLLRGARMLMKEGSEALAEARLEQAVALDPSDAGVIVSLAEVRKGLGAKNATVDAYASLLDLNRNDSTWRDAMIDGARFHLEGMRDVEAASPFLDRLLRRFPTDERVLALQVDMAAFAASDWLEDPERLAGVDGDLLERIVRDADSPEKAVRSLLDAAKTREGRGEMVSSALAAAKRGLMSGAVAAGKRGKDTGLVGRVASVLVKLDMLPKDGQVLDELAKHAVTDDDRERIEAVRDTLEE